MESLENRNIIFYIHSFAYKKFILYMWRLKTVRKYILCLKAIVCPSQKRRNNIMYEYIHINAIRDLFFIFLKEELLVPSIFVSSYFWLFFFLFSPANSSFLFATYWNVYEPIYWYMSIETKKNRLRALFVWLERKDCKLSRLCWWMSDFNAIFDVFCEEFYWPWKFLRRFCWIFNQVI